MPQLSRHDRVPALLSVIGGKRNPAYVAKTKRGREHDDNGDDLRDSLPFDAVNAEPQSSSESAGEDTDNNRTSTTGSAAGRQSRFKFPSFESGRTPSSSQLSSSTSSASDSRKRRRGPGLEKSLSCSSSTSVDAAPASSSAIWSDGPRKAGPNGVRKYGSRSVPPPASTSTSATGRTRPAGAPMRTLGQAAAAIASKDGAATITKKKFQMPEFEKTTTTATTTAAPAPAPKKTFINPIAESVDTKPPKPTRISSLRIQKPDPATPAKALPGLPRFIDPTITPEQPVHLPASRTNAHSRPVDSTCVDASPLANQVGDMTAPPPPASRAKFQMPDLSDAAPKTRPACPVCKQKLSRAAIKAYEAENGTLPADMRIPFRLQSRIHLVHRRAAALDVFAERRYPVRINWGSLPTRAFRHDRLLASVVLSSQTECPYRTDYLDRFGPSSVSSSAPPPATTAATTRAIPTGRSNGGDVDLNSDEEDVSLLPVPELESEPESESEPGSPAPEPIPSSQRSTTSTGRAALSLSQPIPDALLDQMTPGYYGSHGARIMTELVSRMRRVRKALDSASRYRPSASPPLSSSLSVPPSPFGDGGGSGGVYATPPSPSKKPESSQKRKKTTMTATVTTTTTTTTTTPSDVFATQMQRVLTEPRLGGTVGFVQAVLVPELAARLVMEDMSVDVETARRIVRDSVEVGLLVNPDEGDGGRPDGVEDGSRPAGRAKEVSVFGCG